MTLDEILKSAMTLEEEIERSAPGSPELGPTVERLRALQAELERTRGLQTPLIPDAGRAPSDNQQSAEGLARTIHSLLAAAESKRLS